jgi:hypothetical protein
VKRAPFLALLALLLGASPAAAAIVPQQGIGGVTLGMTRTAVVAKVGKPRKVERGRNDLGSFTILRYPTFAVTFFAGSKVTSVATASPKQRTYRGVGVGSTAAAVAAKVAGVKCVTESGFRHCYVGTWSAGKRVTDFVLRNGRVTRVTVGFVID